MAATDDYPRTERGHLHVEAFCLMWYACRQCPHRERIWNSRDGVTPFGMSCPSCGGTELLHADWHRDQYAPDHKPADGQRVWIDMTRERASAIADARIAVSDRKRPLSEGEREQVIDSFHHEGHAPDLKVWGYAPAKA
jgi:hypothetical protein